MSVAPLADRAPAPKRAAASSSAYREIYREHHRFVWRCLLRLGVPEASTEDALQEVFVTAFRRLHTFEHRASLRAWLGGIARRVAFRHRRTRDRVERRRSALAEIPPEHACPDEWLRKRTAATFLQAFLDQLEENKREVFVLCELEGMRGREAAAALGLNENTAYARLRAARSLFEAACRRAQAGELALDTDGMRDVHREARPSDASARRSMGLVLAQLGPKSAIVVKTIGVGAGVKAALFVTALGGAVVAAGPLAERNPDPMEIATLAARPGPQAPPSPPGVATVAMPRDPVAPFVAASVVGASPATAPAATPAAAVASPRPSRAAVRSPVAPEVSEPDPLERQLELVEAARRSAAREEWPRALQTARQYRAEFPRGALAREATALAVEALCRTGDALGAKSDALTHLGRTDGARLYAAKCDEAR